MSHSDALLVLTNGAWHGAWCWTDVLPALRRAGADAVAIELTGFGGTHGASPRARTARPFDPAAFASELSTTAELSLSQIADQLNQDVRAVAGGRPVAIVAHSLGAVVVAEAIERAPELYASVTYISAVIPVLELTPGQYNAEPEQHDSLLPALVAADPGVVRALRLDFDDPARRAIAIDAFGLDDIGMRADGITALLASDAPLSVDALVRLSRSRSGSVPRSYIRCSRDRAVRPALQARIIRELDQVLTQPTRVTELESGHSPFFSHPRELTQLLIDHR